MADQSVAHIKIDEDQRIGEGGFLVLRRLVLTNVRGDGSQSAQYRCDFVERPYGLDAVAIVVYRQGSETEVLLRRGLRPPMAFGRDQNVPIPDGEKTPFCVEIAAGLIEESDKGLAGIRHRACEELAEELGIAFDAEELVGLGAPVVPTPSVIPERLYLFAARVGLDVEPGPADGDGSPMEEGAEAKWWTLDDAIAACVNGEIVDAKTEIGLRRLRDQLS